MIQEGLSLEDEQIDQMKVKCKLNGNLRAVVYSFLSLTDLMDMIAKLSRGERKLLVEKSALLDQPRNLKVTVGKECEGQGMFEKLTLFIQLVRGELVLDVSSIQPLASSLYIDFARSYARQMTQRQGLINL